MNKETRIQKIDEVMRSEHYGQQDIFWKDELRSMKVYQIPLEYLIYNKYNGRILSRTKTLEKQGKGIDPETPEGKQTIERLLWESKKSKNDVTKSDIATKGQLKIGIVTRDGIVIDGNRRLMILNMLAPQYRFFKAIVLPVALEDDPIEIEKLETTYQMGEDEKLSYNPIEKYLKAKEILGKLTPLMSTEDAIKRIAEWMGEKEGEIRKLLEVMRVIDDYLAYVGYDGIYAMADTGSGELGGKEDLFIYLRGWLNTFRDKESAKGFDGYEQIDVNDLEQICFDYIRAKVGKSYDGKDFRSIGEGLKRSHFFGDEKIWRDFAARHFEVSMPATETINSNYPIDYSSENLEASLTERDARFRDEVLPAFKKNIEDHVTDLHYARAADKPLELVQSAKKAIGSIQTGHKNFASKEVQSDLADLIDRLISMVSRKGPEELLSLVVKILDEIDAGAVTAPEEVVAKLKTISSKAYNLQRSL